MDGTVADTGNDLANAINLMRESFGFERKSKEEILKHINFGARAFVKGGILEESANLPDTEREDFLEEAFKRYIKFYAEHYLDETRLYDGIAELVDSLYEKKIKMCVLSNKHDDMTKRIVGELLDKKYFIEVLGGSERFPHKPDPASATVSAPFFIRSIVSASVSSMTFNAALYFRHTSLTALISSFTRAQRPLRIQP